MKTIHRSFAVLALICALAACSGLDSQTKQWLGTDDKDRAKALEKLPQPEVDGVNATLEKQAFEAIDMGEDERAAQFYKQMLSTPKLTPAETLRYKIALAECWRRLGEYDRAYSAFDEILRDSPENLDAREGRGLALMALGKATDAGREFSDIMKFDPKRWRTLNGLGILFVSKNMIPEAMAYYAEALKYSPDNPSVLNNVGLSQAIDRQYDRAKASLEQASRNASTSNKRRQIDLNLAMVYGVTGDTETAKTIAEKHLKGPALDNNLGLYAHLAKDDTLAKTYLNMALSGSQTFYERAWNNLDIVNKNSDSENTPTPTPTP